jgi:teichuronic acid exporter
MTFRKKTLSSLKWSGLENGFRFIFSFVISIVLARLLSPEDFGLVAMVSIFISLSQTLIDGGFGDSLIRKVNCIEDDFNTIFTFNVILSLFIYIFLFILAPYISDFFNVVEVKQIIRIIGIGMIISSFSIVQIAVLRKNLEFKKQAFISFVTTTISGVSSIFLALNNFSYWSLIFPSIITALINTFLLWHYSSWRPVFRLNISILKEHFAFGSKIMFSSIILNLGNNTYTAFIGKLFSPIQLGYYSRADNIQKLPSSNLDNMIRHITYPLLASITNEESNLISKFKLILSYTAFVNTTIMLLLYLISGDLILMLYGSKWIYSLAYLKILCFVGILQPLTSINANLLNVKGKSDYTLYALLVNLLLTIPVIYVGYVFGLLQMTYCVLIAAIIYYLIMGSLVASVSKLFFIIQMRMLIKIILLPFSAFLLTIITFKYMDFVVLNSLFMKINIYIIYFLLLGFFFKNIYLSEAFLYVKSRVYNKFK